MYHLQYHSIQQQPDNNIHYATDITKHIIIIYN